MSQIDDLLLDIFFFAWCVGIPCLVFGIGYCLFEEADRKKD